MTNFISIKMPIEKSITNVADNSYLTSIWFWLTIVELIIILFLIFRLIRKKQNLKFSDLSQDKIRNAKKSSINMDNLMDSINSSRELYKELSRKCHPDKFVNTSYQPVAEEIFQEISKSQRDFEKLSALKIRAVKELNINF